jgi:CO/xanthine dehydrogenase Mo-binding subunit
VGEIAITGAIGANAVWHATGQRVRQFPINRHRRLRSH